LSSAPVGLRVETTDGAVLTGEVRAGESWYAGAARLLGEQGRTSDVPLPLDLSGAVKRFSCSPDPVVGYRRLGRDDLPLLVSWQAEPHVAWWWDGDTSTLEAAESRYGARIDGTDPTRLWVMEVDGKPVGWVQDYHVSDDPEYARLTRVPDAIGLDYAIGDPSWVGRGLGTRALWICIRDVVRPGYPKARVLFAAPDHRNTSSLRVLAKVGFEQRHQFEERDADGVLNTVVAHSFDIARVMG
jgi:RimJ/RimL family protein N-acetyltransferase